MSLIVSRKKLQISDIEKELESQGYQMIENSYDPKSYKIDCLCPSGHVTRVCYYSWRTNVNKCSLCPKKTTKPLNITIEILRDIFQESGCTLLSTQYERCDKPIKYMCPKSHETEMNFTTWKRSKLKCKECLKEYHIKTQKLSFEFIKNEFTKRGYKLLSTEYKNALSKLSFECDKGHIGFTSFSNFCRITCAECTNNKKHTIEEVREAFNEKGYILLSTEYKNNSTKLQFKCPQEHIGEINYHNFSNGQMCAKCVGNKKYTIEDVKESFNKANYTLLSTEYSNRKTVLQYRCPQGHIGEIRYDYFIRGTRCNACQQSHGEIAIRKHLTELNLEFVPEKRFEDCRNINPLPFDYYINNQFIIEFDGGQHFEVNKFFGGEDAYIKRQQSDKIKTDYCRNNKLPLLRISYREFKDIPKHIDSFIALLKQDSNAIHFTNDELYEYLK